MDFSDLGGVKISSSKKKRFDFSDLGEIKQPAAPVAPPKPSFMQDLASDYGDAVLQGPMAMLAKVPETLHRLSSRGGDLVESELNQKGANPTFSRTVNNVFSAAPDIAMMAIPSENMSEASKIALPAAQRSLGLTKRFLGTPFSRGKAAQAAKVALEEGVIPFSGDSQVAFDAASSLKNRVGEKIGGIRDSVGPQKLDPIFESLGALKQKLTQGRTGGVWTDTAKRFEKAEESLAALVQDGGIDVVNEIMGNAFSKVMGETRDIAKEALAKGKAVPLKDISEVKSRLADSVSWLNDNASQKDIKKIVGSIEQGIEKILSDNSVDMKSYRRLKDVYGASKTMMAGLNNEISSLSGNNVVSLPNKVLAAGELASGNPGKALATLGLLQSLTRRGFGTTARVLNSLPRTGGAIASPLSNAVRMGFTSARNRKDGE